MRPSRARVPVRPSSSSSSMAVEVVGVEAAADLRPRHTTCTTLATLWTLSRSRRTSLPTCRRRWRRTPPPTGTSRAFPISSGTTLTTKATPSRISSPTCPTSIPTFWTLRRSHRFRDRPSSSRCCTPSSRSR
uniref:(northern house mosquito) hypothetical protein n=1 Tax=Culex pipiens TaxID=7175 RepID=A0A8D8ABH6_CULPI